MSREEFEKLFIENENGVFTPLFDYEDYDSEKDEYVGFKLIKSAEEVYQEWLENKDKVVSVETVEDKLVRLEEENKSLAQQVSDLQEILLDISMGGDF